jgi:RND family efflux transporter MFP subunit
MKQFHLLSFTLLIVLIFISGCDKKKVVEQTEEIRPVKTIVVQAPDESRIRHFPGRVDANKKADLSFRVSGKVSELLVKEGSMVKEGDIIARLDPTDFKIEVNDKKALFTRANNDFKRGKELIKDGNISKMDYDKLESNYLSARAAYDLAKQKLDYTELKAPFDGVIALRYIQSYEEVQAKENIVTLNDTEVLEIKFDLPENLVLALKKKENVDSIDDSRLKDKVPTFASFQGQTDQLFPLTFKEASTKADEKTQTFTITTTMKRPENIRVLPGMSASVKVDFSQFFSKADSFYLPVSAVVADAALKGTVWLVNEDKMEVEPVSVKVGTMRGNRIQVTDGLTEGQRVVVAGVPFLYKGLKVTLMKSSEQARDNLQHERPVMRKDAKNNSSDSSKEG